MVVIPSNYSALLDRARFPRAGYLPPRRFAGSVQRVGPLPREPVYTPPGDSTVYRTDNPIPRPKVQVFLAPGNPVSNDAQLPQEFDPGSGVGTWGNGISGLATDAQKRGIAAPLRPGGTSAADLPSEGMQVAGFSGAALFLIVGLGLYWLYQSAPRR